MTEHNQLMAGVNLPWKHISRHFMIVRSFTPLTQLSGDKVGPSVLGTFGIVKAEIPNPDVEPHQRRIELPIKHKSDFKSISRAHYDKGIKDGTNELVILYELRRNLFGRPKACFHVAVYPTGTWNSFFDAVSNYKSHEFTWPSALLLYQPSSSNVFPSNKNIFSP